MTRRAVPRPAGRVGPGRAPDRGDLHAGSGAAAGSLARLRSDVWVPADAALPLSASSVLAVCAHPDDESFGLGAVLDRLAADGVQTSVLSLTEGEASTLGAAPGGLGEIRQAELRAAAAELGVGRVEVLDHPDGALSTVPLEDLVNAVSRTMAAVEADLLLVFDEGGVTGHPDHCRATEAALAASDGVPVLAWGVPEAVAEALNAEFGTAFGGRAGNDFDLVLAVDRAAQRRAIARHASQSTDNPVLWRRLELLADAEALRWLLRPAGGRSLPPSAREPMEA